MEEKKAEEIQQEEVVVGWIQDCQEEGWDLWDDDEVEEEEEDRMENRTVDRNR